MKIAHISDLHLYSHGALTLKHLLGRRILGALNLFFMRKNQFSEEVAVQAVKALIDAKVDHVVVTGDFTNLALEQEFLLAKKILEPLWAYKRLTPVPGNHDYYASDAITEQRFERTFGELLWRDGEERTWPVVKNLGNVVIVVLRSVFLCPPGMGYGRIGVEQLQRLEKILEANRSNRTRTIVALHHHLHDRGFVTEATGRLLDKSELLEVIRKYRPALVLHGHDHKPIRWVIEGENRPIVACNGSVTMLKHYFSPRITFYSLDGQSLRVETWVYQKERKEFQAGQV